MNLYRFTLPTALLAMLAFGVAPVQAAEHRGEAVGSHSRNGAAHGAFQRSVHVPSVAVPRSPVRTVRVVPFNVGRTRHVFVNGFRFRPRVGVGFGVFVGYPFGYPYYAPWTYWDYPVGPLAYIPGQGYGGVTFAISPADASITVDGIYAGVVGQYDNPESPLNLPPGEHHIQIQAAGYQTLDINVNVERGEVVPYAGDLQHN